MLRIVSLAIRAELGRSFSQGEHSRLQIAGPGLGDNESCTDKENISCHSQVFSLGEGLAIDCVHISVSFVQVIATKWMESLQVSLSPKRARLRRDAMNPKEVLLTLYVLSGQNNLFIYSQLL